MLCPDFLVREDLLEHPSFVRLPARQIWINCTALQIITGPLPTHQTIYFLKIYVTHWPPNHSSWHVTTLFHVGKILFIQSVKNAEFSFEIWASSIIAPPGAVRSRWNLVTRFDMFRKIISQWKWSPGAQRKQPIFLLFQRCDSISWYRLVNCPTIWSLLLIFGFLYWSSYRVIKSNCDK